MKVLIIGGYGVFGGRLIDLISDINTLEIIVAGRQGKKAKAFCNDRQNTAAKLTPLRLDRSQIAGALTTTKPHIVVDASGPFQAYGQDQGGDPYHVIRACLKAGVNYMDFADAADFVFGVKQFDDAAKKAGLVILSGVSSFPVLTSAVLRELQKDMTITTLSGGIAPSPYAGIGLNVMRAVVSYAGGPVKLLRNGAAFEAKGLTESRRYTIAPPGFLPLRNLHFSLVDVPDLQIIPQESDDLEEIWMGAGPVPEFLHHILNLLAKTRALFRLPSFSVFSPVFYRVLNLMKFGEHRGGMYVEAKGIRDGKATTKSWHLLAEGDDGPFIPSMAIEALIRKWDKGEMPEAGARAASKDLELSDYEDLFRRRKIYTGIREDSAVPMCLYHEILGDAYMALPEQIRELHGPNQSSRWQGTAAVERGTGILAGIVTAFIGFPKTIEETQVQVNFTVDETGEHWQRKFGDYKFSSFQRAGRKRNEHLLIERFGIISVALALVTENERIKIIPRSWSCLGIPLPRCLMPNGESYEHVKDDLFHFDVTIKAPIIGHIVSYRGCLKPVK